MSQKDAYLRYNQSEKGIARRRRYQSSEKCAANTRKDVQLYRERHPEKVRAHKAVAAAVRSGKLTRLPCEACGTERSEAHHPLGYLEPYILVVKWLCRLHHVQAHKMMGAQ